MKPKYCQIDFYIRALGILSSTFLESLETVVDTQKAQEHPQRQSLAKVTLSVICDFFWILYSASGAARTVVYTSLTLSWTLLTVPRREAARLASPQRLISRPSAAVAYERAIYSRLERFISLSYNYKHPPT